MITRLTLILLLIFSPLQVFADNVDKSRLSTVVPTSPVDVGSIFQVIAALLVIILLIFALSWLYRKYGFTYGGNNKNLKVIGALSLGGKEKVVLLQIGNEQILVGVSPGYVRKVHDIEEPVTEINQPQTVSFISSLNNEIRKVMNK